MAGTNEILSWAQGVGANVATQAAYSASSARTNGVGSGVADSSLFNKQARQAVYMARVLSQWAVDQTGGSIFDNGDEPTAKALLTTAVQGIASALITSGAYATLSQMNAGDANLQQQINAEVSTRGSQDSALQADYIARIAVEAQARANGIAAEAGTRSAGDTSIINALANYITRGEIYYFQSGAGQGIRFPTSNTTQFLIQWGRAVTSTGQGDYIAFPAAFSQSCMQIVCSDWGDGANCFVTGVIQPGNTSSFRAYARLVDGSYKPQAFVGFIAVGQ